MHIHSVRVLQFTADAAVWQFSVSPDLGAEKGSIIWLGFYDGAGWRADLIRQWQKNKKINKFWELEWGGRQGYGICFAVMHLIWLKGEDATWKMQWFLQLSDNFCLSAWEEKNTKTHMLWDGVKLNKWDFHGKSVWNKSAVKLTDCTCMSNCATTEFWLTRYPRGSRNAHSMEQCNLRKEHTTSIWTWTLLTMYSHSHPHMAVDGQWSVYSVTHRWNN